MRIVLDELAEAETIVILADQTAHAIDALVEAIAPAAELRRRHVTLGQAVGDGIGG